jgi:GNAT superfamily N-acetyltransferase
VLRRAQAFVCRSVSSGEIVGIFYVKTNFPGRAGHICNGGFIVAPAARGQGVGRVLAESFALLAADLGYRASFFNLVFATNPASLQLWRSLKYKETGRVPNAIRKKDGSFIDAFQFYNEFPSAAAAAPAASSAATAAPAAASAGK